MYLIVICAVRFNAYHLSRDFVHLKFVGRNLEMFHQLQPERDSVSGVCGAKTI
jgi:hypothetical protein